MTTEINIINLIDINKTAITPEFLIDDSIEELLIINKKILEEPLLETIIEDEDNETKEDEDEDDYKVELTEDDFISIIDFDNYEDLKNITNFKEDIF